MENEPSLQENIKPKTLSEMEALAKKLFGKNAEVFMNDDQWVIKTGVYENLDFSEFEGTPAMQAYNTPEISYGSDLERWLYKNGYAHLSIAEGMRAYNKIQEAYLKDAVGRVKQWVAEGKEFDWEGGPEHRDEMLKIAEEKGW